MGRPEVEECLLRSVLLNRVNGSPLNKVLARVNESKGVNRILVCFIISR